MFHNFSFICLKTILATLNAFAFLFKINWLFDFLDYFLTHNSVALIYAPGLLVTLHCLSYCRFIVSLQIGGMNLSALFSFSKIVLTILVSLVFHMCSIISIS